MYPPDTCGIALLFMLISMLCWGGVAFHDEARSRGADPTLLLGFCCWHNM